MSQKVRHSHKSGQLKMDKAQHNHNLLLKEQEEQRENIQQRYDFRMNRASQNSISLPRAIMNDMSMVVKSPTERAVEGQERVIVKQEFKKLKDDNLQVNLMREQKKLEFKKYAVIEKELKYMDRVKAQKNERMLLEKCKIEVHHQSMKNKEHK